MNEILKLMGNLLEKNNLKNTLTQERRDEIINKKAPSGLKKNILVKLPEIMDVPVKNEIRLLQEHNVQLQMDDLVNKVNCEFNYNQQLSKKESLKLSHKIIGYFMDCIKKEIAKYDWNDLIQKLILNYENILFARSFGSFNNLYYFNNYDDNINLLNDITNDNHELDKIALPTRFLIEVLAAEQNFNSNLKISTESFDNLMALSYSYIEWAFGSDYINSKYVDFEIMPLKSGRFGIKSNIEDILDTYRSKKTLEQIDNYSTNISNIHKSKENPNNKEEKAFKSEFGINLTDYANFISVLLDLSRKNGKDIVFIAKSKLTNILKEELSWEYDKSTIAIDSFSLKQREKWDIPPEGFSKNDIYPWIFRRPLSYYLKPLIIKNDDNEMIIYGFRNVYHSGSYLLHLIYTGLYKTENCSKNLNL